jgi:Rrf2 family protein
VTVQVSAKADYALRALLQMAACHPVPLTMSGIVGPQALPRSFAETILAELRRAGFLRVSRVGQPSYSLSRPPDRISVGSVLRAVDGPLTRVRGLPPEALTYSGVAQGLAVLWLEASARLEQLLDEVSLHDLVARADAETTPSVVERVAPRR